MGSFPFAVLRVRMSARGGTGSVLIPSNAKHPVERTGVHALMLSVSEASR